MNDPSTVNCRIYVGNIKENTPKSELQNIFAKYGTIRGVMFSRNFGFVQFDSEASANNAIENENQKVYNGRKLVVSKVQKKGSQKPVEKGPVGGSSGGQIPENSSQNAQNSTATSSNTSDQNTNLNDSGPNNNKGNVTQSQMLGNHQPRQAQQQQQLQWRNRNNNRNNNNNNNNDMNTHTDRERSPFDQR